MLLTVGCVVAGFAAAAMVLVVVAACRAAAVYDKRALDDAAAAGLPLQRALLEVFEDFDSFGGATLELAAWELGITPPALEPAWRALLRGGVIGTDQASGPGLFRIAHPA